MSNSGTGAVAGCAPHEQVSQVEFSSGQHHEGSPATEFRRTPDRAFVRKFYNATLPFPDGLEVEIWSFEDETSGKVFPAPALRANEGEIVHATLHPSKRVHTIHHHGIEPDPRNDGVGHTSFEVTGSYTYQFLVNEGTAGDPNSGAAGTYFYHCHVNTVLHVQMGMFGPMIFDPPSGRGMAFVDDPVGYDTRAETLMVPYAVDPRWHRLSHAAGLSGEDVGLERFEPTNFYLLGGDLNDLGPAPVKSVGTVLATVPPAKPGLLRVNTATYFPVRFRFLGGLKAEVFAHDGRPLRDTSQDPSPPVAALTDILVCGPAERYDMRMRPPAGASSGSTFRIAADFIHWVTGKTVSTLTAPVRVL